MAVEVQVRDRHHRAGVKKRLIPPGVFLLKRAVDECQTAAVGGEDAALSRGNPVRNGVQRIVLQRAVATVTGVWTVLIAAPEVAALVPVVTA